ncbi:uncharacterized protein LOC119082102 [Bradysia coprophila]|uniref:uncharacterized protein LOC119082102 n=1 Tax=Bradysia coprophila TaxID=38358 RepID=UPI00187D9C14|nr:uncharacterized protein LOC119082102 [Bradysia coprophila]
MKVIVILFVLCFGATIISSALSDDDVTVGKEWWNENYYLKFNSPGGKTFYVDFTNGIIDREKDSAPRVKRISPLVLASIIGVPLPKPKVPFISFVSTDFKIYEIYFDNDSQKPRLEESEFVYENKNVLIRPRLESFVGPNKKLYQVVYNDGNAIDIAESPDVLNHFQIKTFGPYEKFEHTYDFSEDGTNIVSHTILPIPVQANRSIPLPELGPNSLIEENSIQTFVKFNSPSGTEYHITTQLNIVPIQNDVKETSYITFTESNGRTYDINIDEKNGNATIAEKDAVESFFGSQRLYSFVAPNQILYRIEYKIESGQEVPTLVSSSSDSSDLQVTLLELKGHYNRYVKYIFSDNGKKLFDRVDEIDWTPLNELPAVPVEVVTADYLMTNLPFLTLYTPSGNNYYIFKNGTHVSIAVDKEAGHSDSSLISYFPSDGRKVNINFVHGADPILEREAEPTGKKDLFSFQLVSFTTPDQKEYKITSTIGDDDERKISIQPPSQVKEPIDLPPADGLSVTIRSGEGWKYIYRFTWNGDKLVETSKSKAYITKYELLTSLIGK